MSFLWASTGLDENEQKRDPKMQKKAKIEKKSKDTKEC